MAKKDKQSDMPELQRDDALFETLGKNKKRKKRLLSGAHEKRKNALI